MAYNMWVSAVLLIQKKVTVRILEKFDTVNDAET